MALVGVLFAAALSFAQSTAVLSGTVVDPAGAVVPQAKVVCRNIDTDWKTFATTNHEGLFRFQDLPVGLFEITITREGFAALFRGGIQLLTDQTVDLTFTLRL